MLAPVVIYTYNRIEHLKKTVDSLIDNYLAKEVVLIIVSDGCGRAGDEQSIIDIRNYINSITGFKEVIGEFRESNLGAIGSVLEAEKRLVNKYGRIISMEDDNVCSKNFLDFMNQALNHYENDEKAFSVCGYCPAVLENNPEMKRNSDYYNYHWNLSWGYGIWKDKYNRIYDLENNYELLKKQGTIKKIKHLGGMYLLDAVKRDYKYNADFPDAWLGAKMTYFDQHSIVPSISKVKNIGSDGSGHHQGTLETKFDVVLDEGIKREFDFNTKPKNNSKFIKEMVQFYNGSVLGRISRYLGIYHYVLLFKKFINAK